jgi:hypothetical protein
MRPALLIRTQRRMLCQEPRRERADVLHRPELELLDLDFGFCVISRMPSPIRSPFGTLRAVMITRAALGEVNRREIWLGRGPDKS